MSLFQEPNAKPEQPVLPPKSPQSPLPAVTSGRPTLPLAQNQLSQNQWISQNQGTAPNASLSGGRKRLGDLLLEEKIISLAQLERALSEAKATASPVGAVLIKLGFIDEVTLGKSLARLHGLDYVSTAEIQLRSEVVQLLPDDFIKRHLAVPISVDRERKRIEVLMARPDNQKVLDEITLITGYRTIPKVSTHREIINLVDQYFVQRTSSEDALKQLEEDYSKETSAYETKLSSDLENEMSADDAPVVQLVNSLLMEAIEVGASDIHIEPQQERLLIRFRIDGILKEVKSIPKKMGAPIVSRIKVASGMDIAERRRPQDGRMKLTVGSQDVDMRVNTLAVQFGEKVVIRLLKATATTGGLEKLGLEPDEAKRILKMIKAPHGIILVTGPTGAGKTTTLYGCLREINSPVRNITTIEDPIEYPLPGINQTQISHKAGLDFAVCLRAILRQDPDVIMVGEIRDKETLEAAIHAALTGHLVFSTVHTNSTAKTITRLLEMGAPYYLVSSSVIGILAQRLVRKICTHCRKAYKPSLEELTLMGMADAADDLHFYAGVGCDHCGGNGYSGRLGLYEIMNFNREIQDLIDQQASAFSIQDAAVRDGMFTLAMDGKRKVLAGLTTVAEVVRVLGMDLED